ncbi:MAG TPA: hypothetical protein VMT30_03350 [Candidatus Saccharimonadia bacterium]|nr:hypothetical protein [Candidatus Saccharimonadia bacterium]
MASQHHQPASEPHYLVLAQLCEPNYKAERKFLDAEMAYVERKLDEMRHGWRPSVPSLGFFSRNDWHKYAHELATYDRQLEHYAAEVDEGVVPVRFSVINEAEVADTNVHVAVNVKGGRIDAAKKPPARPARLDGSGKGWPKLAVPRPGFSRRAISIKPHTVGAVLSNLGGRDGVGLVNETLHLHLGPDTEVSYVIMSQNVAHETGEVELVEKATS